MNAEIIANIVLLSILAAMQLFAYITCVVWRKTKYHKGLHNSGLGFSFLFLSFFVGVFIPIIGLVFPSKELPLYEQLAYETAFCLICLVVAIRGICFCIYLDGNHIVKRTLFSEVRIDLTDSGTTIDDSMPHSKDFWTSIYSSNGKIIQFRACAIGGDANQFIKDCCEIQNKKNIS